MSFASIAAMRPGVTQALAFTATSATTNAFGSQTYCVRLSANAACHFRVVEASGGTATTSDVFLPANWVDYVIVGPGQKIAAVRAATDGLVTATSGTLNITELS